jgi:hypothetical protein
MAGHDHHTSESEDEDRPPTRLWRSIFSRHFILADETTTFILVNALDLFITYVLLAWPESGGYETNPIARRLFQWDMRSLIAFKFGMATVAAVCCELVAGRNERLGRVVLLSLTVIVGSVAAYGLYLIAIHVL